MLERKKLSFFLPCLPQDGNFVLKKEGTTSLLYHNENPDAKIVAMKISSFVYLYRIILCFKNDECRKQFKAGSPSHIRIDSSECDDTFNVNDLELHLGALEVYQNVSAMKTNYIGIYDANSLSSRNKILVESLSYINAFESMSMGMNMINKINMQFNINLLPLQFKNIKERLTKAYNKGTMSTFFKKIGLHADIGTIAGEYLNEEDGKNLAFVAKDIALMGTKKHNEEADKILSQLVIKR